MWFTLAEPVVRSNAAGARAELTSTTAAAILPSGRVMCIHVAARLPVVVTGTGTLVD
jgi:hypothetical protein